MIRIVVFFIAFLRTISVVDASIDSNPHNLTCVDDEKISKELSLLQNGYSYNPYVDPELWDRLSPYFLPENHPIRAEMDRIFRGKKRVTRSKKSLKKAKFIPVRRGEMKRPYIVSHINLQGYLLKLYIDKQYYVSDGKRFLHRIHGAQVVQEVIDRYGFNSIFKVPKKWIYPLPAEPSPPKKKKYKRKNFILVVEDMDILAKKENRNEWKSSSITTEILDALYILIDEGGLSDSIYAFNIPFSKDGKLAVVDTEYYHRWPIRFARLRHYLSPEMRDYWTLLISSQ